MKYGMYLPDYDDHDTFLSSMKELTSTQRRYLSRMAHDVSPQVMIGKMGFTDAILEAVDGALERDELVKVRFIGFKADRFAISEQLAQRLLASLIRIIGNVAILYRQNNELEKRRLRLPA